MKKLFRGDVKQLINEEAKQLGYNGFPHREGKQVAFTLAEVLITLGIIGVVAALTMPTLVQKYQKHRTATQLKTVYSMMNQAIKMSEIDNGLITEWEFPANDNDEIKGFLAKYIAPYLKHTKIDVVDNIVCIYLNNGTILLFSGPTATKLHSSVCLDGNIENSVPGKNRFSFYLGFQDAENVACGNYIDSCKYTGYLPYDYIGTAINNTKSIRDFIKDGNGAAYGCNSGAKNTCSKLIQYDGWKISDDYPW